MAIKIRGITVLGYGGLNDLDSSNIAVGAKALSAADAAICCNVVVGADAGTSLNILADNNIIIGHNAQASTSDANNEITLGNDSHSRLRIPGLGLDTNSASSGQVVCWTGSQFTFASASDPNRGVDSAYVSGVVTTEIGNLVDAAPIQLDTLNEIAAAINNDSNFAGTITTLIGTKANASDVLDSADVLSIANAAGLDSTDVTNLIDASYIQARQDFAYGSLDGTPNVLDSADVVNLIDSAYVQIRQSLAASGVDSDAITALVDSAYIQARQDFAYGSLTGTPTLFQGSYDSLSGTPTLFQGSYDSLSGTPNILDSADVAIIAGSISGLDSTGVANLVDSAYVQARQDFAYGSLTGTPNLFQGSYDSLSGTPTLFQGSYDSLSGTPNILDSADVSAIAGSISGLDSTGVKTLLTDGVSHIKFTGAHPSYSEGTIFYDSANGTFGLYGDEADVTLQIGQEEWLRVYNNTGTAIQNGTPVYISGEQNDLPTVAPAAADQDATVHAIGLATHTIENSTIGYVTTRGVVNGVNTTGFASGARIHVGITPGTLSTTAPTYPNYAVDIGYALNIDSNGSMYVNVIDHVFEVARVTGDARIDGDLTVAGNFNLLGSETITQVANLQVADNFVYIGAGDTVITNFAGSGTNDATIKDYYEGDSSVVYNVEIIGTDSTGDTIKWYFGTDSAGLGFDSANGPTSWNLGTDGNTNIPLRYNVTVDFVAASGHDSGDRWFGDAAPVNVDLGLIGNYNTSDAPYTHAGVFRDASDQKFKFFNRYDPEVEGDVNVSDTSFELATVVVNRLEVSAGPNQSAGRVVANVTGDVIGNVTGDLTGSYLGFDSDAIDFIDSAYVQARQDFAYGSLTGTPSILDSADVSAIAGSISGLDSTGVTSLVDAAYVQARQDFAYGSLTGTPNLFQGSYDSLSGVPNLFQGSYDSLTGTPSILDSADVSAIAGSISGLDSTGVTTLIDSDYIETRRPAEAIFSVTNNGFSAYSFTGDGFASSQDNPTIYLQRGLTYKFEVNASGHPFEIRVSDGGSAYSSGVTNNAAQVGNVIFTVPMNAPNTLVYQCTAHSGMIGDIVILSDTSYLDSGNIVDLIDSAYIQARSASSNGGGGAGTDSATVTTIAAALIDSAVDPIDLRYDSFSGDSSTLAFTLTDSSTSEATLVTINGIIQRPTVDYSVSGNTLTMVETPFSGDIIGARTIRGINRYVTVDGIDSTSVVSLIDSAYVQARSAAGGVDSAAITALIDSAYVQARSGGGGGVDSAAITALIDSAYVNSKLTIVGNDVDMLYDSFYVDSNQPTVFTLSESSEINDLLITINGLIQRPFVDYTLDSSIITLSEAATAGSTIGARKLKTETQTVIQQTVNNLTGISYFEATTNTQAISDASYLVDCSSNVVQITLPASPTLGDVVEVIDATGSSETYTITVARNGNNILGAAENFTISTNRAAVKFVYYNASQGWVIGGAT